MAKWPSFKISPQQLKSLVLNLVGFTLVFMVVDWYQSRHLLAKAQAAPAQMLSLPRLNGQMFDHQQLAGKSTVVYFFAPWCQVCHYSIGNLENLYQSKKDDIHVIAVALSYDSANEIQDFVNDKGLSFPVLLGTNEVMSSFKIRGFPTYYVLDEQGAIRGFTQGYSTELGLRLRVL